MKKLGVIFLIAAFLFHSFGKLVLIVGYEMNRDYITKTFCENTTKPKMRCNGKCHLAKELNKEEKREKEPSGAFKQQLEILLFSHDERIGVHPSVTAFLQHYSTYLLVPYSTPLLSIEHPPCC